MLRCTVSGFGGLEAEVASPLVVFERLVRKLFTFRLAGLEKL
jgi:hypothetical protein